MAHGKRIHLSVQEPQETWVGSLGWEDPLEEEMATHSRILTGTIPWTENPGRLQSMGLQKVRHDRATEYEQMPRESAPWMCQQTLQYTAQTHSPPAQPWGTHSPAAQRVFSKTPLS